MAKFKLEDGTEVEAFTADEVTARLEQETSGLKSKLDELLGETKTAKQKAKELEEAQSLAEEARAKEKGEFKELYEREQKAKSELSEKYEQYAKKIQAKDVELSANSIALELTRDTKRADLLKKEISQFARYSEDGVKFEMGGVEVDRAKVIAHITESYPFLVDGNQSSGGGAPGSKSGGGAAEKGNVGGSKAERIAHAEKLLQQTP